MRGKPTTYIYAEADPPETGESPALARYTVHSLDEFFTHVSTLSVTKAELQGALAVYKDHAVKTCVRPGDTTVLNSLFRGRSPNKLQVCSPFLFTAEELTSGVALYQMRHLAVESALGGWQCLSPIDWYLMQLEPLLGKPHPLSLCLRSLSPGLPVSLLYQFSAAIGHPGWFVSREDPTGGDGVASYLRLCPSRSPKLRAAAAVASKFVKVFESHHLWSTDINEVLFSGTNGLSGRMAAKMAARTFCKIMAANWLELSCAARYGWPAGTFFRPEDYFSTDVLTRYLSNAKQYEACSKTPG